MTMHYKKNGYECFDVGNTQVEREYYSDDVTPKTETVSAIIMTPFPTRCKVQKTEKSFFTPNGQLQKKFIYEKGKHTSIEYYDKQKHLMDRTYVIEGEKVQDLPDDVDNHLYYEKESANIALTELEIISLLLKHIKRVIPEKIQAKKEILSILRQKAVQAKKQEQLVPPHTKVFKEKADKNWQQSLATEKKKCLQALGFDKSGKRKTTEAEQRVRFYMAKTSILGR